MKTNPIEITVSGFTGCGKSEVLEVISKALRDFYGITASIVGATCDGAIEEARTTQQTAKGEETVFVLIEENITGELTLHRSWR